MEVIRRPEVKYSKVLKVVGIIGSLGLVLSGCGTPEYKDGKATVVQHVYDDKDVEGVRPAVTDPEHFFLYLQQCGYKPKESKGIDEDGCKVFPYEVNEHVYESTPDGANVHFRTASDGHVIFEVVQD